MQDLTSSRDEALRANKAMQKKLTDFEGTLRGVSEETLVVLEQKEAVVRRLDVESKKEREEHNRGRLGCIRTIGVGRRGRPRALYGCDDTMPLLLGE